MVFYIKHFKNVICLSIKKRVIQIHVNSTFIFLNFWLIIGTMLFLLSVKSWFLMMSPNCHLIVSVLIINWYLVEAIWSLHILINLFSTYTALLSQFCFDILSTQFLLNTDWNMLIYLMGVIIKKIKFIHMLKKRLWNFQGSYPLSV